MFNHTHNANRTIIITKPNTLKPHNETTNSSNELHRYLSTIISVFKILYNTKDTNYKNTNKYYNDNIFLNGPIISYEHIHLEDSQKDFIEYPPILISNDFEKIYTNIGILDLSNIKLEIKGINLKNVIYKLNLKIYNNSYYYIDKEYSFNTLNHYYSKEDITNVWKSLISYN